MLYPMKKCPYCSSLSLQQLLLRPGFTEQCQMWNQEHNQTTKRMSMMVVSGSSLEWLMVNHFSLVVGVLA